MNAALLCDSVCNLSLSLAVNLYSPNLASLDLCMCETRTMPQSRNGFNLPSDLKSMYSVKRWAQFEISMFEFGGEKSGSFNLNHWIENVSLEIEFISLEPKSNRILKFYIMMHATALQRWSGCQKQIEIQFWELNLKCENWIRQRIGLHFQWGSNSRRNWIKFHNLTFSFKFIVLQWEPTHWSLYYMVQIQFFQCNDSTTTTQIQKDVIQIRVLMQWFMFSNSNSSINDSTAHIPAHNPPCKAQSCFATLISPWWDCVA